MYDQFEFDIPTAEACDSYACCKSALRRSVRAYASCCQCVENMP